MKTKLPLTETVFYVLLAFQKPSYGYQAIKNIELMSRGNVRIAAGTMYGAIENLLKQNLIVPINSEQERRKIYITTKQGTQLLKMEVQRMKHCINIFEKPKGEHYDTFQQLKKKKNG
ncbi:PadR family transcriptional regulator [Vagococcus elongatus]|uniref:PadR family transcriptional regulator n=1 Tax=Vagococcus elongatus TaxID=180344 RepID=A0A430AYK0_9ENTE|nr:PadR family transcriptional regulator [Vagococcus elongatus]RSU13128.1 PadR family transcriptional regulator [Vagococcus elongatus]